MSDQVGNPEDRFSHNEAHIRMVVYMVIEYCMAALWHSSFTWVDV